MGLVVKKSDTLIDLVVLFFLKFLANSKYSINVFECNDFRRMF